MPFTAAITGFHRSQRLGQMLMPGSSNIIGVPAAPSPSVRLLPLDATNLGKISSRSSPAQKALSPAPVSTATLMSSLTRSARHTMRNSACIFRLKALLTSGRFIVTYATWSRSS